MEKGDLNENINGKRDAEEIIETLFVNEEMLRRIIREELEKALTVVKEKPRRFYSRRDLRDILDVSLNTINGMVKRGVLQPIKLGRNMMFDADEVDEAIEKCRVRK